MKWLESSLVIILEDAFNDPEVSDIYVIDWETIYRKSWDKPKYHKHLEARSTLKMC